MEKDELNECLAMFCAAVRREDGTEFKVSSLKAIRAAIDRYLRQPTNNKPWSIVGDSAFQKSNKVLNAICTQMMQEGKVGPTIHKNPITRGVTNRSKSMIEKVIDISLLLDIIRY